MPNDVGTMSFITLRENGDGNAARRAALDALMRANGARCSWRTSGRAVRAYGLVEVPSENRAELVRTAASLGAGVLDPPIIAVAVFPTVAQALPAVEAALYGPGKPVGVRGFDRCEGGAIVEWDLEQTPASVIFGVIDAELLRHRSGRTVELLTPLLPSWSAKIAADGLRCAEMSTGRVLEDLLEEAATNSVGPTHA
ncbi:MAG: hypothetical protein JOY69_05225 [Candidatus Eremiobacteraeota bacterium]|nr:hypothetical protein [Candidatus Eremiobacteraeota bacterium]